MSASQEGAWAIAGAVVVAGAGWALSRRRSGRWTAVSCAVFAGVAGGVLATGLDLISRGDRDDALPLGSWRWATPPHVMPALFLVWGLKAMWSRKGPVRAAWRGGTPASRALVVLGHAALGMVLVAEWTDYPVWGLAALVVAVASCWAAGLARTPGSGS